MSKHLLATVLGGWLCFAALVCADDPLPLDPVTLTPAFYVPPRDPKLPQDRPSVLPNLDPRLDIPPLLRPPVSEAPANRPPPRRGPRSDYDPSYLYLPERNPGVRQPPCPCLPLGRWWIDATYFLGKTQNDAVPTLATLGGVGIASSAGQEPLDRPFRSGLRIDTGVWLDRCQNWGIDASFFFMESSRITEEAASRGVPTLARPFIAQPGEIPSAFPLAVAGFSQGSLFVTSPLSFLGADVNGRHTLLCEDRYRVDLLAGYRFIRMSESLTIRGQTEGTSPELAGVVLATEDTFRTVNLFNGAQVGIAAEYRWDRIYVSGSGKAAFGLNWHRLDIDGSTALTTAGTTTTTAGGFLTGPSNTGRSRGTHYAVVSDATLSVGYQIADHWRAQVGYTFLFISSVAQPGRAIDTQIGTTLAGVVHPLRQEANTDFWMHGINLGFEARY